VALLSTGHEPTSIVFRVHPVAANTLRGQNWGHLQKRGNQLPVKTGT
jgi:hypothetical protein